MVAAGDGGGAFGYLCERERAVPCLAGGEKERDSGSLFRVHSYTRACAHAYAHGTARSRPRKNVQTRPLARAFISRRLALRPGAVAYESVGHQK